MNWLIFGLYLWPFLANLASAEHPDVKGPPVAAESEVEHIFRRGSTVKVACPIRGSPAPFIEWSRNGEPIDYRWDRFSAGRRQLRIKPALEEDTGVYVCRGINGFGTTQVRVVIHVVDDLAGRVPADAHGRPAMAPPVFTRATLMAPKAVRLRVGQTFRASCHALGSPEPELYWFKDGRHLHEPVHAPARGVSSVELVVSGPADAGTYSCRARNLAGNRTVAFGLEVSGGAAAAAGGDRDEAAIITDVSPSPAEVAAGGAATLRCRVKALAKPSVKWLKKLDDDDGGDPGREKHALTVGKQQYQVLDQSRQLSVGPGVYETRLEVRGAGPQHAGTYICFVTSNTYAFTFKSVRLSVIEAGGAGADREPELDGGQQQAPPQGIFVVVVCLSVVVFALLVTIVASVIRRRAASASPPAMAASAPASPDSEDPHRPFMVKPTPGPGWFQQQQQQLAPPAPASAHVKLLAAGSTDSSSLNTYEVPYAHLVMAHQRPGRFAPSVASSAGGGRRHAAAGGARLYPEVPRPGPGAGRKKHYFTDYESQ